MIFEVQRYSFIFQDRIYSLAIGFVTGFFNQMLACFLYKGRVKVFVRDIIVSLFFTVSLFSYTISFANYKILRWYNVLFALIGAVLFSPCFSATANTVVKLIGITALFELKKSARRTASFINKSKQKKAEKRQKITQKNSPEVLKREDVLLYN